jgi:hypothetical protein
MNFPTSLFVSVTEENVPCVFSKSAFPFDLYCFLRIAAGASPSELSEASDLFFHFVIFLGNP